MSLFELDEHNKKLLIENQQIRKVIDDIEIIHYKSSDEQIAKIKNELLLVENKKLKDKLRHIYDI